MTTIEPKETALTQVKEIEQTKETEKRAEKRNSLKEKKRQLELRLKRLSYVKQEDKFDEQDDVSTELSMTSSASSSESSFSPGRTEHLARRKRINDVFVTDLERRNSISRRKRLTNVFETDLERRRSISRRKRLNYQFESHLEKRMMSMMLTPNLPSMDARRALFVNEKETSSLSIEELEAAIEVKRAELECVRRLGKEKEARRAVEKQQLVAVKVNHENALIEMASIAKKFIGFWEYAEIVGEEFEKDEVVSHTWWCLVEAWVLRVIHHAMMWKNQKDIVVRDCNSMIKDCLRQIPKLKEEGNLAEACALTDLCKEDTSQRNYKEHRMHHINLQQRMISRLKQRATLDSRKEPRSFEDAVNMTEFSDDLHDIEV